MRQIADGKPTCGRGQTEVCPSVRLSREGVMCMMPERDLPPNRHEVLREHLLREIATDQEASPRTTGQPRDEPTPSIVAEEK
jgi:hypothetical protein